MRRTCTFAAAVGLLAAVAYGQVASTAPTTEPPVLSYRFVEGRKHVYEVQLVACVAGDRTTRDGLIEFSVTSVRNGQVSMQFTNLPLGVSTRAGSQEIVRDYRRAGSPSRIPLPRFGPSANRPETSQPPAALLPRHAAWTPPKPAIAVFSQNGELLSGATIARMPLLLGYQDQFVIAPLPRQAAAAWTSGAERHSDPRRAGDDLPGQRRITLHDRRQQAAAGASRQELSVAQRRRTTRGFHW